MNRITWDEYFLHIAAVVAKRSTCIKRQYGAVIVQDNTIISTGYNGSPRGEINCCDTGICHRINEPHNSGDYSKCKSVHAEQNSFLFAGRKDVLGGTLYLYGEENGNPIDCEMCPICRRMAVNIGIKRVVCARKDGVLKTFTLKQEWQCQDV